jgi:hypothetical protein
MEKLLRDASVAVGAVLLMVAVAVGVYCLSHGTWVDLAPKEWLSEEDKAALKDPEAANKAAYEKMSREAWERSKSVQPQPGWDRNWKK